MRVTPATFLRPFAKGYPDRRRSIPIHAFVGPNGSGKSLCAIRDSMRHLDAGRPVLSTVPLLDWRSPAAGVPHPLWIPLQDFGQLLDFSGGHVLLDEVTGVADAREFSSMPVQVRNLLVQLRKRDVTVAWTSPAWQFADVTLRRVTQAVTLARGFVTRERPGEMWRDRRLFLWRTYDAQDFEEFTAGARDKASPLVREWFWGPGSDVFRAYSTRDQVLTLGHQDQAGLCLDCGGKRSAPRCSCERVAPPARRLRAAE